MHSLDVAQMTYILLKTGPDAMADLLELTPIEQFAILIAGVSHDYGHDGYNNGYHVAMQTERFTEHGGDAVQERYHFAESYKVLER